MCRVVYSLIRLVFAVLVGFLILVTPVAAYAVVPTSVAVSTSDPFGRVEAVSAAPGTVSASGWAVDPDTSDPIIVQMYVDGSANALAWAGSARPDVGAAFPAAGASHGFALSMGAAPGAHSVCVYAINVGPGASRLLSCSYVVVPDSDPIGRVEAVSAAPGTVSGSGWAVDPDTSDPIIVQMYVDGSANALAWAGSARPDVGAAFPAAGASHGFALSMGAAPGAHSVCVYAINVGPGASRLLSCSYVVVPGSDPFGSIEWAEYGSGTISASGWAVDPDTAESVIVQMYVDGAYAMTWADLERQDVASVYPWAGTRHGFSLTMDASPAAHSVCLYAINVGPGASRPLGCRVLSGPPFFVYGSLRSGQSGYYLLAGKTTGEVDTRMPGLDLYRLSGSSYPYAVGNETNTSGIVGERMSIHPAEYSAVVASLDRYERYDPGAPPDNQIYVRALRATREGVPSWAYVAGPRQSDYLRSSGILITSGDWLRW